MGDLLPIQLLRKGSIARKIGKEDGDDLALSFQGAAGGKDLVSQMLGGVGGGAGGIEGRGLGLSEVMATLAAEFEA
jgi:hypothetical protein